MHSDRSDLQGSLLRAAGEVSRADDIPKLRVFISWAGPHAENLGKAFATYLRDVVNTIEPFMSGVNIDKGTQWAEVLGNGLQNSSCAIVCLTPESIRSVWVEHRGQRRERFR